MWFRRPAASRASSRSGGEDLWRDWEKGKIVKAEPEGDLVTYTVDLFHEVMLTLFGMLSM